MAATINFKKEVRGSVEQTVAKVTEALQSEGFGVLTRIDFDQKVKEKLGKEIKPVVILGACNPQLALDAFLHNADVTSLLPCNAVVREVGNGIVSIEIAKPTALMKILEDQKLVELARDADKKLENVIEKIRSL
ncbi:MAG: DUF302 domain-containing protein [Bdellovibrionales bacterium]